MSETFVGTLASASPVAASPLEAPIRAVKNLATPHREEEPPARLSGGDENIDLHDMRLPSDVATLIEPVLREFDMHLELVQRDDPVVKHADMHVAVNGGFNLYLLHFDAKVLEDARWAREVTLRGFLFRSGDEVRILSKDCKEVDPAYEFGWQAWSKQKIAAEYVEWRRIAQLGKLREADRPDLLQLAFRFPPTVHRRSVSRDPQGLLEDTTRFNELVTVIAKFGQSSGPDVSLFMNDRLVQAGLPEAMRLERANWPNNYPVATRDLIVWLFAKGRHPSKPGYSVLASLLVTLLDQVGLEDRRVLIETIRRYSLLVPDSEVEALRAQYLGQGG